MVWRKSHHRQLLVVVNLRWLECQITECITGLPTTLVQVPVVDLPTQIVPLAALQHAGLGERHITQLYACLVCFSPHSPLDMTKFSCLPRCISCTWYPGDPKPLSMIFLRLGASSNVKSLFYHANINYRFVRWCRIDHICIIIKIIVCLYQCSGSICLPNGNCHVKSYFTIANYSSQVCWIWCSNSS